MKIYLSARYSRREELRGYSTTLHRLGHGLTGRWLMEDMSREDRYRVALKDMEDIVASDAVVLFTEGEESVEGGQRGGRHVEFGYALALGKRIFVVGPRENVFHHVIPYAQCFDTLAGLKEGLRKRVIVFVSGKGGDKQVQHCLQNMGCKYEETDVSTREGFEKMDLLTNSKSLAVFPSLYFRWWSEESVVRLVSELREQTTTTFVRVR